MIRRHDSRRVDPARIDDPEPQLGLGRALAGAAQIGREIALEPLVRERPAVTEQAQAHLAVGDDRAAARGIAPGAGERSRDPIVRIRHTGQGADRDERGREPLHPNTSSVIVRNQASASTASAARVARGASAGLTPPEPGTSAICPPDGW